MNRHIENIIIGTPIISEESIFGLDGDSSVWEAEKMKTIWTNERNLPRILGGEFEGMYLNDDGALIKENIKLNFAPSISEVRRNRKDLNVVLDHLDYIEMKYGKKRLFILVGLKDGEVYEG